MASVLGVLLALGLRPQRRACPRSASRCGRRRSRRDPVARPAGRGRRGHRSAGRVPGDPRHHTGAVVPPRDPRGAPGRGWSPRPARSAWPASGWTWTPTVSATRCWVSPWPRRWRSSTAWAVACTAWAAVASCSWAAALALLVVGLAYTAALTRWGSPELRMDVDSAKDWMRDHLGAVPHPIEALLGVPALAWGVTMRDRRRQGWWVCAFGATATATAADPAGRGTTPQRCTSSLSGVRHRGGARPGVRRHPRGAPGGETGTSSRPRGRRIAHRPEPPRLQPLH